MQPMTWPGKPYWTRWQLILFRFVVVYFILYLAPWTFLDYIPGGYVVTRYYYQARASSLNYMNTHVFKLYKVLVPENGSGDTSMAFTQIWTMLLIAFTACLVWSIVDKKNENYNRSAYWFRIMLRFFLIIQCFGYGFDKVFLEQMSFPNMSQLATPLGDFLPMRLNWMFMGYSDKYQSFSGIMEVVAGILLLFRRTSTFGTLFAAGVFANVFAMNIAYDIPVKLFSMHLLIMSLVLLAFEYRRIINFFILNRNAETGSLYDVKFPKKWIRITLLSAKLLFIGNFFFLVMYNYYSKYTQDKSTPDSKPIRSGMYEVKTYKLNGDTIPPFLSDTLRWRDIVFEKNGRGSVNTRDTLFRQRYRRGYFNSEIDTTKKEIAFSKTNAAFETFSLFSLHYELPDSAHIILYGKIRNDSVYAVLQRSSRHFQLAERQFHWLSEYNR
jgi:hypothetical protein